MTLIELLRCKVRGGRDGIRLAAADELERKEDMINGLKEQLSDLRKRIKELEAARAELVESMRQVLRHANQASIYEIAESALAKVKP